MGIIAFYVILLFIYGYFMLHIIAIGATFLPFAIAIAIDVVIYKFAISRIREKHKALALILAAVIAAPTLFIGGVSAGMVKNVWNPKEQKTKYEKRIDERNELEKKGIISFNAEIRNEPTTDAKKRFSRATSFSVKMTMTKSGNLIVKGINDGSFTYALTDFVYYKDEEEPCGFAVNATRESDGKIFRWRIHRQKPYFHDNNDKIKLVKSSDFDAVKEIIVGARSNSRGIEDSLCVDSIKN